MPRSDTVRGLFLALGMWLFATAGVADEGVSPMSMQAVVQAIGQHTNMLPRERGVTLPLVEIEGSRIVVRRLFYLTHASPEGSTLSTPQFVATADYVRGRFLSLEPLDFVPDDLPPAPWRFSRPPFDSPADIVPEFERIWQLYDALIGARVGREDAPEGRDLRAMAAEFLRYLERHAEKPLRPYYRHYGGDFLDFVRLQAGL